MGFFPFYTDIENQRCLVIGGGAVAAGKIERLLPFRPSITVIAPEICDSILRIECLTIVERCFCDTDLENAFMVIAATNDRALNIHISELCRARKIPVNVVDVPKLCTFYFPAIVRRNNITIGISTEGKSPIYARYLKEKINAELDEETLRTAELLTHARVKIRECIPTEAQRKAALETVLAACINREAATETAIDKLVEGLVNANET